MVTYAVVVVAPVAGAPWIAAVVRVAVEPARRRPGVIRYDTDRRGQLGVLVADIVVLRHVVRCVVVVVVVVVSHVCMYLEVIVGRKLHERRASSFRASSLARIFARAGPSPDFAPAYSPPEFITGHGTRITRRQIGGGRHDNATRHYDVRLVSRLLSVVGDHFDTLQIHQHIDEDRAARGDP